MTNIKVGIRFRPLLEKDFGNDKEIQWKVNENIIESTNQKHKLKFDNVFDGNASNEQMYDVLARPIVSKAMEGCNGTIFAYGQTSSGKTHSMIGDESAPGIILLAIKDIFKTINASAEKYSVKVGYIEIYNDKIYDLFESNKTELRVFESNGNVVTNQKEFIVCSEDDVFKYFNMGNNNRRIGETMANERSSRSHTIFQLTIESQKDDTRKISNLYLVDLAGSEKPDVTSSTFNEGLHINKSLLALGKIIRGLSKNSAMVNVNFRECKLTRILSPALGGNSLTAVICTVSPVVLEETYHTISFAQNARKVKVNPVINLADDESNILRALRLENARLRREVFKFTAKSNVVPPSPLQQSPMQQSPMRKFPQSPLIRMTPRRLPQSPTTRSVSRIPLSPMARMPASPKVLPSPFAHMKIKRRNDLFEFASVPAKKLKFDDDKEMVFLEQNVVESLINQVGDTELEVEGKLEKIAEEHGKAMELKDKIIKTLENELDEVKKLLQTRDDEISKLIQEKTKISFEAEANLQECKLQIDKLQLDVKDKNQKILDTQEQLTIARKRVDQLENKLEDILLSSPQVIVKNLDQELLEQKEDEIENLKFQLEMAQSDVNELKFDFETKLEEKNDEIRKLKEQFKQRSRNARSQLVNKISELQNKFLVENEFKFDFKSIEERVRNFFETRTTYKGDFILKKDSEESCRMKCVCCESILRLKGADEETLQPLIIHFKIFHKTLMID